MKISDIILLMICVYNLFGCLSKKDDIAVMLSSVTICCYYLFLR